MLKARVATALVLVAILGGVLFFAPPLAAVSLFSLMAVLAAWEWAGLMNKDSAARRLFALLCLFFCWQFYLVAEQVFPLLLLASAAFWGTVIPFWLRQRWALAGNDFSSYGVGLLVILPTWAAMIVLLNKGPWVLLAGMAVVWVADVAAYFAGRAFGRHKLAPTISPGKTWEGVAGGVAGVVIYGVALAVWAPAVAGFPLLPFFAGLVVLAGLSVVGDLYESLLKRQAGLKDSSGLLPGHGGILDRIDALTPTLPLMALIALVGP